MADEGLRTYFRAFLLLALIMICATAFLSTIYISNDDIQNVVNLTTTDFTSMNQTMYGLEDNATEWVNNLEGSSGNIFIDSGEFILTTISGTINLVVNTMKQIWNVVGVLMYDIGIHPVVLGTVMAIIFLSIALLMWRTYKGGA